ncbi:MAG: glutamate synthase [Anaerolineae bacterium]
MGGDLAEKILAARRPLAEGLDRIKGEREAEGGCGVIGLACSFPVAGRHIIGSVSQMCNRGNGKGGGIAIVGCFPDYPNHYAINIGLLDLEARVAVEKKHITPYFDVAHGEQQSFVEDYRQFPRLEIEPPRVVRYFCRVKEDVLARFAQENGFDDLRAAEDEFVYQNSFKLNRRFYAEANEKQAFVLSHGRNMMILKAVGYAEDIAHYYQLEDLEGYIWIGHQRYPTRGRVWHPGGAHPYIGLDEALVHNGDFANYYAVTEYLKQRGYYPLFLTDTEVSVLLFDLYNRTYGYPLEYTIEALAPTTERDFALLPEEKQPVYRALQRAHLHGSPDGPWFFILARSLPYEGAMQLIGITDTSMLRPQVFALQEGTTSEGEPYGLGIIASEKQAIDAALHSLSTEFSWVCPIADRYWNARGGSHSDGGAFVFTVTKDGRPGSREDGKGYLVCTDKFGRVIRTPADGQGVDLTLPFREPQAEARRSLTEEVCSAFEAGQAEALYSLAVRRMGEERNERVDWNFDTLRWWCQQLVDMAGVNLANRWMAIEVLTLLHDRPYDTGTKKRSAVLAILRQALDQLFRSVPAIGVETSDRDRRIGWDTRHQLVRPPDSADFYPRFRGPRREACGASQLTKVTVPRPEPRRRAWRSCDNSHRLTPRASDEWVKHRDSEGALFIDAAEGFPPQGDDSVARLLVRAYRAGWHRFILFNCRGDRFLGCGLGPDTQGVRIDVYGSSGDYLGSGIDGAEVHVHGDAQDQVGQILASGKLVIHGSVGQSFLYGAKGGVAYVLGNAAGRPLINAVGQVRAVINGTCLDYAAESFMAGAPLGGGFLIINGLTYGPHGQVVGLDERYPGSNFFSLASGGAGYVNDPHRSMDDSQLNGGRFTDFTEADWAVIRPYLEENQALFGLTIEDLLRVNGSRRHPTEVFRKVVATGRQLSHRGA